VILKIFKSFGQVVSTFLNTGIMGCAPGGQDLAHNPICGSVKVPNDKLLCFSILKDMLTVLESYTEKTSSQQNL